MKFSQEDYSVTLEGRTVILLRKEYFLLKYLFENSSRAFSRDELLDAVWSFEEPTDRTVDDHIYRLRKKIFPFRDSISIKTVKGFGYMLKIEKRVNETTLPVPEEIAQQSNQLFDTYYKYGQGKALEKLVRNKTLGFPVDESRETLLLWLQSDFEALLKKVEKTENILIPFLLYGFIERNTEKVINILETVLQKNELSENVRMDLCCFSLPFCYLKADKPRVSLQLVDGEIDNIKASDHGFLPFLYIMKTIILFYEKKRDEVVKTLHTAEHMLKKFPFLREQGALKVIQGLVLIEKNMEKEGKNSINEGIQIIHKSGHSYYFLLIYQLLNLLLSKAGAKKELIIHYQKETTNYYKHTNLCKLKSEIEKQVFSFI